MHKRYNAIYYFYVNIDVIIMHAVLCFSIKISTTN